MWQYSSSDSNSLLFAQLGERANIIAAVEGQRTSA